MKYLSNYIEDAMSETFKAFGAFFAFSDKQFKEEAKDGINYTNLGTGLIVPKGKAGDLIDQMDKVVKTGITQDIKENGINGIINRELNNHEAGYTGDITSTVEALDGYNITEKQVYEVYKNLPQE